MTSRLAPRTTRDPWASRVPMATSLCPDTSGATRGSRASRSVRQVHVHVGDDRGVAGRPHVAQRPSPALFVEVHGHDAGELAAPGSEAMAQVRSVLALSATVIRKLKGKALCR